MVPESSDHRSIDLYKATSFPSQWEKVLCLMDAVRAADATLYYDQAKWWMFCNISEFEGTVINDELFLFYTEDLLNPDWKPHALNPIIRDCSSARPAGNLFIKNGKLYRPSQDCSYIYGYGIKINEVIQLNENSYEEKCVEHILPNWQSNLLKNHTYNLTEHAIVIDAMHKRNKLLL